MLFRNAINILSRKTVHQSWSVDYGKYYFTFLRNYYLRYILYIDHRYISFNNYVYIFTVLVKSPLSRSCKRCGHGIHQTQKFCDNCGYKIDVCPGKIDGNPCTKPTNSDIKFCSDCGTINPDYIKGKWSFLWYKFSNTVALSSLVTVHTCANVNHIIQ